MSNKARNDISPAGAVASKPRRNRGAGRPTRVKEPGEADSARKRPTAAGGKNKGALASAFDQLREAPLPVGPADLEQFSKNLARLLEESSEIREFYQRFENSNTAGEQRKSFQRLFEAVIGKWVDGAILVPDVESWADFCARVGRGLSQVASSKSRGERVAIFSSGGPIGVAMQRALNLSPQDTLRVAWMSLNCSYSEFLFSGDRFTLSTFNAFPHLDDAALLTYR